jgi:hypothetical protein
VRPSEGLPAQRGGYTSELCIAMYSYTLYISYTSAIHQLYSDV